MRGKIISIGNSKGVRIPKPLLEESGLLYEVEIKVKKGEIKIVAPARSKFNTETAIMSERVLEKDWNKKEEDVAWASLQSGR